MSTFAFRAIDVGGNPSRGEIEASSDGRVGEQLRQRGLIPLEITELSRSIRLEDMLRRRRRVKSRDMAIFSRQFATLIESGMPMLRSLYTLEDQTENEKLREAIAEVRELVEAGNSVSAAMERHTDVFDPLYVAIIRSGEGTGRLDEALGHVAVQLEKLDALRRQVRSAMVYPILVGSFAMLALIAIVSFIVPVFEDLYKEIAQGNPNIDTTLPFLTQITVGISDLVTQRYYVLIALAVAGVYGFKSWKRSARGRDQWDRFKLRLPMKIGDVVQKVALARWSRTFSGLVSAGVPVLQAIQVTGSTAGNTRIEAAMEKVYENVKRGGTISRPLDHADVFPSMVVHMVGVGEETGALSQMLTKIADFYEVEVEARVKALTSIIEPLLLVVVGAMVGFIVISMYLPLFTLYDRIG